MYRISIARGRANVATLMVTSALLAATLARAAEPPQTVNPGIPADPLRKAYYGDLHLHTANSFDAAWGGVRTTPRQAYQYAQGQPIEYFGKQIKRRVPLDFLAISDHAEYMGVAPEILDKDSRFEDTNWYESLTQGNRPGFTQLMGSGFRGNAYFPELNSEPIKRSNWQRVIAVAEEFNQPGHFTALVAFEWSDMPNGSHNHRVVVFRGPKYPEMPFSALDSRQPQDLWRYADTNRSNGIDSVLIPHNSNLSNGMQFSLDGPDGKPMSRDYAGQKARNEKLVEITQLKGTSETLPVFSPDDEFAGFETIDHYVNGKLANPRGSYVREGLMNGFNIAERTGVNPYRMGFVGGSDSHSGTMATEENNYTGLLGDSDLPSKENAPHLLGDVNALLHQPTAVISASGITGVWAEQNSREAIFAALQRREVFATSGTRIQVRMFGGWNYPAGMLKRTSWLADAYKSGVPMGGDLARGPLGLKSPRFLLQAQKDPDGANLDRIQIVKVWRKNGVDQQRIYDVAWSGDRKPDAHTGKVPAVGNTVDAKTATYSNSIGAVQLSAEWVDPQFDAAVAAAYYARVIEIPTPRWSTYLSVQQGLPLTTARDPALQERAWTSPIFYAP